MKKILQYLAILFVSVGALIILFSFFNPAKAEEQPIEISCSDDNLPTDQEIECLKKELTEQKVTFHKYAPIARRGKVAIRYMALANQKANVIREDLAILGFDLGTL